MDVDDFNAKLTKHLDKQARKWQPQVAVRAPRLGVDYRYGPEDLPFHSASVGKLAPAAIAMQLIEQQALRALFMWVFVIGFVVVRVG